jgi:CheY-like chemotaxis protein
LSQALSNLLTNAAKYTDDTGRITLNVELTVAELKFAVKDNGIGIDPAAISGLFEMFSQLEPAIDRAEGGLGIGLALVKGLVTLHGGRVEVMSPGVGLGSEFSFYLPRSRVVMGNEIEPSLADAEERRGSPEFKILIADDNRDAVDSLAMLLEMDGYHVTVAYSGQDALYLAETLRPQVVLLDIGMPDMSGHEVARAIRRAHWGSTMRLIAVTGWGQVQDQERTSAAGFDRHLTKPVDPDRLGTLIHELLRA